MAKKYLDNVRINPSTGEREFYFPMELKDPADKEYAGLSGLEIGMARLGFRKFEAIFIPCLEKSVDAHGNEVFLKTPSDVQRRIYKALCKDELDEQEDIKQDGRCNIPDGRGGTKRCPLRIPNPTFAPGGDAPKTLPVRCQGCKYEPFKQAHTVVEMSCLDSENDDGEVTTSEVPAPKSYYAADRYEELREQFLAFVKERKPKLLPLAEMLTDELTKSEASRELGDAWGTVTSRTDKLKELLTEFLENIISL